MKANRIRKPTNLTLDPKVVKDGKKRAKKEGVSFSVLVEKLIKASLVAAIIFSMTHCAPTHAWKGGPCRANQGMTGF